MKKTTLLLCLCFSVFCAKAQDSTFHVIGYFAAWAGDPNDIQFNKLTQINYSFALPEDNGNIGSISEAPKLSEVVELAHDRKVKVFLTIGGWDLGNGGGNDEAFEDLAATDETRKNFAKNVMALVGQYNLDGIDIDWEYPNEGKSGANFTLMMKELYTNLHAKNKQLSAAVAGLGANAKGVTKDVFQYLDFLNIMAYDGPTPHASMEFTTNCLNYWIQEGCPKEKIILGLPFYGREPYTEYKNLVQGDVNAANKDQMGEIHYNGIETIKKKTLLAKEKASGVMIWEINMDVNNKYSLLKAIQDALKPVK